MQRWRNKEPVLTWVGVLVLCLAACAPGISPDEATESGDHPVDDLESKASSTQYEAEDRSTTKGCAESATHAGYTGRGYMQFGGNGTWIEWNKISAQAAGEHNFTFRYANGSTTNRRAAVFVNGTKVGNVAFSATGGWANWKTATLKATLRQGENVVRVKANTQNGGPYLDNLVVEAPDTCPEGNCGGTPMCASANEWESVTLSCTGGTTIERVTFASYGTPNGSCTGGFSNGTCHAASSLQQVEAACVGKQSCTVEASNDVFGDPCGGVPKRLAVTYTCGTTTTPPVQGMPVFLMAGQSNMVGNVDRGLFDQLMSELESGTSATRQQRLIDRLKSWYQNTDAMDAYSAQGVALEASELIRLHGEGLVNATLTQPNSKVYCTSSDSPLQPLALNCGNPYGPELVLGRALGSTSYAPTSLIKIAEGGTTLYADWLPPSAASRTGRSVGYLYKQLSQKIKSLQSNPASVHPNCASQTCRWAGFIWFQGENDSLDAPNAQEYQQNLKNLISDVRSETGSPQLPVVVVQINAWAQSMDYGKQVANAQQAVVNSDPSAKLVVTNDLGLHYHYDSAAQLVIGARVAKTLLPMLGGTTDECPNDPNKTAPEQCGCGVPEGTCSGQGGLKGTYFNNIDFTGQAIVRTDASVNFDWGRGSPDPSMDGEEFSVRWTGFVRPQYTETYTFYTVSDDAVRLWIDGNLIIDNWTEHSTTEDSGTISLQAGRSYAVKMEYFESGGDAVAKLLWSSSSQSKQIIPKEQLSSDSGGPVDNCPSDPNKTEPGVCGCGVPEGSCGGTLKCPATGSVPPVTACDGVLLTDPSSVEARSSGITNTSGPAGATALRIGADQSIDIKDAGCMQLGKGGADFSLSMWLKATAGSSQIIGTTSQHSFKPGFLLYTEPTSDGNLQLRMASYASDFDGEIRSPPFKPGTWVHAVLRYDGNGAVASATLDLNLNRKSGPAAANVYNDRLRIGDEGYGAPASFEISELRSYARLLSDGEVRALFLDKVSATGLSTATLRDALTQLEGHVNGSAPLSASALATAARRFSSASVLLGTDTALMDQAFHVVASYETKVGPLFMTNATKEGIPREEANDGLQLARIMLTVHQAIVDWVYVSDSVQGCVSQLQGKRFRTADYFPGVAPAPTDPNKSYSVTVDATLRADWGHPVAFSKDPVRRPTGLYLSPGSIAEVSVPQNMVNAGFSILVGAHTVDMTENWIFKRMDRVTTSFPITKTVMRVANPLGGGIYIVVPYLANLGRVNITVKNVIEAPFFSYKSWHKTTAAEWQTRRTAPAPWADFESDKYLMQVPRSWIYASGDQTALMRNWDTAMDGVSELMGFPPDKRNRTVLYQQIDVILQPYAYGIGYPQVNNTYDATEKEDGNKDHWFLRDPSASDTDYHELGHAQLFSKFRGEEEAAVNMLYPYVRSVKFGVPFDQAFALSMGIGDGFAGCTPDDAAMYWMVTENFRAGREMDYSDSEKNEMRYQQRGYAKYADIYRIFGWQALRSFWYQENLDYNNGTPSDGLDPVDSRILRMSIAAGADLTPLIHFWGIFPVNETLLKQKLTQAGIGPSEAVRAHIARYRNIAPRNNTDFNALYERMFPGRPGGESPDHGAGWFDVWRDRFNQTHGTQIRNQVDAILSRYY